MNLQPSNLHWKAHRHEPSRTKICRWDPGPFVVLARVWLWILQMLKTVCWSKHFAALNTREEPGVVRAVSLGCWLKINMTWPSMQSSMFFLTLSHCCVFAGWVWCPRMLEKPTYVLAGCLEGTCCRSLHEVALTRTKTGLSIGKYGYWHPSPHLL